MVIVLATYNLIIRCIVIAVLLICNVAQAKPDDFQWFQDAKFGIFIHWGPASLTGKEMSWSRSTAIPKPEYDNLYKKFDPKKFDAASWMKLVQDAGAKYVVFVTKHMDGFCMYDSNQTNYTIMNGPFKRDITAEVAKGARDAGLKLGFYFCCVDEYYPDWDYSTFKKDRVKPDYNDFRVEQLKELCTKYGGISILWFDEDGRVYPAGTAKMVETVRKLQPGILVNDRCFGRQDYYTPEKKVGAFDTARLWETCSILGKQWSWNPQDEYKSPKECIQALVSVVGRGGNLLLNMTPDPDGEIIAPQANVLREIGVWLKKYGKSIYGTHAGPYMPGIWGVSTFVDDKVYLHILKWPVDGKIDLPSIGHDIFSVSVLTGGKAVFTDNTSSFTISVPKEYRDNVDTIVELRFDSPIGDVKPIPWLGRSLTTGKNIKASNELPSYSAARAVDNNPDTDWRVDNKLRTAWLEVDLGSEQVFDEAYIRVADWVGTKEWNLQIKIDDGWKTVYAEAGYDEDVKSIKFEPFRARYIRLNFIQTSRWIAVYDFELYPPGKGWQ